MAQRGWGDCQKSHSAEQRPRCVMPGGLRCRATPVSYSTAHGLGLDPFSPLILKL